jgi:hypothetical protein
MVPLWNGEGGRPQGENFSSFGNIAGFTQSAAIRRMDASCEGFWVNEDWQGMVGIP